MVITNPNDTQFTVLRTVYRPNLASKANNSLIDPSIFDFQGAGTAKVEIFKNQVVQ